MNFCSSCGNKVSFRIPPDDDRKRFVCDNCEIVHYTNPRIIVGCIPVYEDRILLCRRAIEPRRNFWTLPAGFMENGETTSQGAARETWEEARAKVEQMQLYRVFDIPQIHQVYMFYRCQLTDGTFGVGPESLESQMFSESEIPWDELAFHSVRKALLDFFDDRRRGEYPVQVGVIQRHRPRTVE